MSPQRGIQHFPPKVVVISIGKNLYRRGKFPYFKPIGVNPYTKRGFFPYLMLVDF
jgi:hypothetical protein